MALGIFKKLLRKSQETKPKKKAKKTSSRKKSIRKKTKKTVKKKPVKKISVKPKEKKAASKKTVKKKIRLEKKPGKKTKEKEIGTIIHYFNKISVGIIKLKSSLKLQDKIRIKGAKSDFSQVIDSMQVNHKAVSSASKGMEVGVKVKKKTRSNDKVYLVK